MKSTRTVDSPIRRVFVDYLQESLGGSISIEKETSLEVWYRVKTDYVLMLFISAIMRRFLHDGRSWDKLEIYKVGEGEQYCAHLNLPRHNCVGRLKVQIFKADEYQLPKKQVKIKKKESH